jgi:hypothetical protein
MKFDEVIKELDRFPELGLSSCTAVLSIQGERLELLYVKGKLETATITREGDPLDVTANAVIMSGIPRHLSNHLTIMVRGFVASESQDLSFLTLKDRMQAFHIMPEFLFWATEALPVTTGFEFESHHNRNMWLSLSGFRLLPEYEVQGSQDLINLTTELASDKLGPLPTYFDRDKILIKGLTVYAKTLEVSLPSKTATRNAATI